VHDEFREIAAVESRHPVEQSVEQGKLVNAANEMIHRSSAINSSWNSQIWSYQIWLL
jgi:hypothetical protein